MEAFVRPTAASLIKIMVALRNNTLLVVENRIRSKASHSDDESQNLLAAIAASLRQLLLRLLSHSITGVLLRVHLAFSADSSIVASATPYHVCLWNAATGKLIY